MTNYSSKKVRNFFSMRMSHQEYKANVNALNIFFGAVLGFVLASAEQLTSIDFGITLMCLATTVAFILYITFSRYRILYSIFSLVLAYFVPDIINDLIAGPEVHLDKIRPTLLVWTLMAIVIEFQPRNTADEKTTD